MINRGVALGIGEGISIWFVLTILVGIGVIAVKTRELWGRVGLYLMLIGGGANLYLRVRHGGVIDNLSLGNMLYNNVWDYLIVGGLLVYGYSSYIRRRRDRGN